MKEKNMKSVLINTVHDSIVVDIFPTEEEDVIDIFTKGANRVIPALKERYDINFNIPLDIEMKIGYDWLNLNEVTL